jgi:hypothetical protein
MQERAMSTTSNTDGTGHDDALMRELLLSADQQEVELPREVLDHVRARLHEKTVRSRLPAPTRATARWVKRACFAAAGTAAVVLIALVFCLQPSSIAWSQVADAVRALPWVHMKSGSGRGAQDVWISFSRDIVAMRRGDTVRYEDLRSGVCDEYDARKKTVFRLSASDRDAEEIKAMKALFDAVFRGDAVREDNFPGPRIVKQQHWTATEQGRRWIMYQLELEPQGGGPKPAAAAPTMLLVIRVNPETKLPESMTFAQRKVEEKATFDYPAEGPADIYALGVPRDVRIDDHAVPPELKRIAGIVQQNRRDFGDYCAIASGSDKDRPNVVYLVRCKGNKWRVDTGVGDTKHVASAADLEKWWRRHGRHALPEGVALCDGRQAYTHSLARPNMGWERWPGYIQQGNGRAGAQSIRDAGDHLVELLAYPPSLDPQRLAASPTWRTVRLDPKGEDGPPGTVRVVLQLEKQDTPDDRNAFHKTEFWLQPKLGYAVVKYAISDCPAVDADPRWKGKRIVHEYDGFRQTPRGTWYPTISRHKNVFSSKNTNAPGGIESRDRVTLFCLDFSAELPDELFSTKWHGDLLRGFTFGERTDKPAARDLGAIQPPGGVPLSLGEPGKPVSVEGLERVRRRLEAVPKEDLEKWVVELERIIDKKLKDGLPSARQVCRTDFVIHASAAFDGLKWNAKTADNLFRRAQTLPASEGKAWKEAFEVLLKKEIGQTDTTNFTGGPAWAVPLVLIPVDALFDGQRYSADRAQKYRARLKQLTADDVSLWRDKVDEWGGTRLDAAMNIVLLDEFFAAEKFQRDKLKAAVAAKHGR